MAGGEKNHYLERHKSRNETEVVENWLATAAIYYSYGEMKAICSQDLAKIELTVHAKTQKGLHFLISALDVVSV